jgi:hypothetical protein
VESLEKSGRLVALTAHRVPKMFSGNSFTNVGTRIEEEVGCPRLVVKDQAGVRIPT